MRVLDFVLKLGVRCLRDLRHCIAVNLFLCHRVLDLLAACVLVQSAPGLRPAIAFVQLHAVFLDTVRQQLHCHTVRTDAVLVARVCPDLRDLHIGRIFRVCNINLRIQICHRNSLARTTASNYIFIIIAYRLTISIYFKNVVSITNR